MAEPRAGRDPVLLGWSGGKDSMLALHWLRARHVPVAGLLCTVTADDARVSMHGVAGELVARQAEALGCALETVSVPAGADNAAYEAALGEALARHAPRGLATVAFGDLFLADVRAYREASLRRLGWRAEFPLWGADTAELARHFVALGYRATVVCVDPRHLDAAFAGREFDAGFLADLPPGTDPCGENGEFHTFVWSGPMLRRPVAVRGGEIERRAGYVYRDLLPG